MYQLGDRIVYGVHGVCNIVDRQIRVVDRKKVEYFVLSPVDQPQTNFFIPTQNQAALSKLRQMVTVDEIKEIIWKKSKEIPCWIYDENRRKLRYRELGGGAGVDELIGMIRDLHIHRAKQLDENKKFHLSDERFLRDMEKILISEFALVLNIPSEDVRAYITKIIDEKKCSN